MQHVIFHFTLHGTFVFFVMLSTFIPLPEFVGVERATSVVVEHLETIPHHLLGLLVERVSDNLAQHKGRRLIVLFKTDGLKAPHFQGVETTSASAFITLGSS